MKLPAFLLLAAFAPASATAQYIGGRPPEPPPAPLVGTVETPEAALARNVRLIAINPKNYDALLGAGRAALRLGDPQAAIGFFGRAEEINANHWAPKAGQGSAMAHMGEAQAALGLFEQAQALGATQAMIALDRGLAFDLLGRQADAQSEYRAVLSGIDEPEARRRLALSLAISGRKAEALAALDPLLARRDPGARRARAFILALGGDVDGARQAIALMMPGASGGFDPFLRRLPTLGPGQKAAAVHLGIMPAEGAAVAALPDDPPPAPPVRTVAAKPMRVAAATPVRAAPAKTATPKVEGDRLTSIETTLTSLPSPPPAPKPIVERSTRTRTMAPQRTLASRPASDEEPSASRKKAKENTKAVRLAAKGKAGETDAKSAKNGKAKAEDEAKPAKAASNSRVYVQLAGGANVDRMEQEFARIRAKKASLFKGRQPVVSAIKGWSRLLVGPFKDADEAQEFVNDLHAAKLEGFVWTAPSGLKLEKLASK